MPQLVRFIIHSRKSVPSNSITGFEKLIYDLESEESGGTGDLVDKD